MTTLYNIHQHLFHKSIIDREIVGLALLLSEFIKVSDDEDRRVYQVLGSVDDFVYTSLTFDLTYGDDLDGSPTDAWVINKRKQSLRLLNLIGFLIKFIGPSSNNVQWKKIGQPLQELTDDINDSDDIIRNQNFEEQIKEIEKLVDDFGSNKIKPFYSVDPRKAKRETDPIDYVSLLTEKIINGKFFGVKQYTTTGFSPTDPVLFSDGGIHEFCVANDIPVTVQNSDGGFGTFALKVNVIVDVCDPTDGSIIYYNNELVILKHDIISAQSGKAIFERANHFNHPLLWKMVLDKYPKLRSNLAHFGGSGPLMELVHHEIPDEYKKMTTIQFTTWMNKVRIDLKEKFRNHYLKPKNKNIGYCLKESVETTSEAKREKYWNQLFELGIINNFSSYQLDLIESDAYPNLYVDLSAFSEGEVYNFPVPYTRREIRVPKFKALRKKISNSNDRAFFKPKYEIENTHIKDHLLTYEILDDISYPDELKLNLIFRGLGALDKDTKEKFELVKNLLSTVNTDQELVEYMAENRNFSILEELNAFKMNLYDSLEDRHKEKILYGSDFYFTQIFGPRHEQYVEDFKNVFGIEFKDMAQKHCQEFLGSRLG